MVDKPTFPQRFLYFIPAQIQKTDVYVVHIYETCNISSSRNICINTALDLCKHQHFKNLRRHVIHGMRKWREIVHHRFVLYPKAARKCSKLQR